MKAFSWEVTAPTHTVHTPDGPLVAHKGDVLTVIVRKNWERTARVVEQLDRKDDAESA